MARGFSALEGLRFRGSQGGSTRGKRSPNTRQGQPQHTERRPVFGPDYFAATHCLCWISASRGRFLGASIQEMTCASSTRSLPDMLHTANINLYTNSPQRTSTKGLLVSVRSQKGPYTVHFRTLVPNTMPGIVVGTRALK